MCLANTRPVIELPPKRYVPYKTLPQAVFKNAPGAGWSKAGYLTVAAAAEGTYRPTPTRLYLAAIPAVSALLENPSISLSGLQYGATSPRGEVYFFWAPNYPSSVSWMNK